MKNQIKNENDVKKILCEQLELLAEKSKDVDTNSLVEITKTMCSVIQVLFTDTF